MSRKKIVKIATVLIIGFFGCAPTGFGQVRMATPEIDSLIQRYVFPENEEITGWRILISVSRDRRSIEDAKRRFERQFPEFKSEMAYVEPHYKLLACAFQSKMYCNTTLARIRKHFSGATEVIDEVTMDEVYETLMKIL